MKRIPEFLSMRGAAKIVGINGSSFALRYHKGQTPKPDGTLNGDPIWRKDTIEKYASTYRQPKGD